MAMAFATAALGLALQVLQGKWFMVFASFLIMSTNGSGFVFAIYSKEIKSVLGYNQQALNTVSFFKDLGSNVSIISGLVNEIAPPWVLLLIGSGLNLFGYLMVYFAITSRIAPPRLWQMCLFIAVGANSQSFGNTAALVTCVKNFPENRGMVLSLLKGFIGISGAIFAQLYLALYGNNPESIVLLVAWLPGAVSVAFLRTIRIFKKGTQSLKQSALFAFLYISLALAAYIMIIIIVQKKLPFTHAENTAASAGVLFLLFLPLAVVIREELAIWKQKVHSLENNTQIVTLEEHKSSSLESMKETCFMCFMDFAKKPKRGEDYSILQAVLSFAKKPKRGEDYSILQAVLSFDMAVLFVATICGNGGALAAVDNLGQIGESLGYPSRSVGTLVSLMSIWNFFGRVTAGFASEVLLAKYKFPRPLAVSFVLLLSCAGYLLIAFGVPHSLYFASMIIGFCFGAQNPLLFVIISELFGLKHFSTLYNFGAIASPVGSFLFNVRVAGRLYDRETSKQAADVLLKKSSTCIGVQCFRLSFIIISCFTLLGALVMLILVWRTWDFYRGDIYARFKEGSEKVNKGNAEEDVEEERGIIVI